MESSTAPNRRSFRIIRVALLAGQLAAGAIFGYLGTAGGIGPLTDEAVLRWIPIGFAALLAGAGVLLLAVLRPRWQRAATFAERAQTCLLGWALAEGLTLFGAVYILLSGGEILLFLAGLGLFFITWWVLPLEEPA